VISINGSKFRTLRLTWDDVSAWDYAQALQECLELTALQVARDTRPVSVFIASPFKAPTESALSSHYAAASTTATVMVGVQSVGEAVGELLKGSGITDFVVGIIIPPESELAGTLLPVCLNAFAPRH
jgi:hypothetical protein